MILRDHVRQIVFCALYIFERGENSLFVTGDLSFCGNNINWSKLSFINQTLVVLKLSARNSYCITLYLQTSKLKYQFPISSLDARDCVHGTLPKLCISQRKVFLGNLNLPTAIVESQPARQWLYITKGKRSGI